MSLWNWPPLDFSSGSATAGTFRAGGYTYVLCDCIASAGGRLIVLCFAVSGGGPVDRFRFSLLQIASGGGAVSFLSFFFHGIESIDRRRPNLLTTATQRRPAGRSWMECGHFTCHMLLRDANFLLIYLL